MVEWRTTTLEECTDILGDGLHGTPKYTENGEYAFVNGNNLVDGEILIKKETKRVDYSQYEKYKKPLTNRTILVSINGTLGNVGVYGSEKIILGKSACYFNVKESVDKDFIYYIVSSPTFKQYLESNATGTTIKNISLKQMREYTFELPEIGEQKRISSVLRKIDEKIKNNRAINKNLEQQIQELYKEWFITNREANWQRIPLSDIIFFQEGPGIRNWQYVEDGVKFINIRCINNGLIDTSTANKISLEEASGKYSHFMLEPYDIVMSCSGTLGRYAIVLPQNLPLCLNTSVIRFRPKQYKDDYSFVYGYMTSKEFLNQQITMANGSAQVNFGPTHLKKIEIVEPPVETRKKFNDLVFPLIETQISLRAENTRLVEIRDTLLPCLMSGEIDVSEVEI